MASLSLFKLQLELAFCIKAVISLLYYIITIRFKCNKSIRQHKLFLKFMQLLVNISVISDKNTLKRKHSSRGYVFRKRKGFCGRIIVENKLNDDRECSNSAGVLESGLFLMDLICLLHHIQSRTQVNIIIYFKKV